MTVFQYALKRLLRNKFNLFTIFLLTPLFIALTFSLGTFDRTAINIGLVDLDGTPLTEMLGDSISDSSMVYGLEEADIRTSLARSEVDYVLVIDSGFSQELIAGGTPKLRSYSIQETNIASRAILKVEGFLGAAQGLAKIAGGDESTFYAGMDSYLKGGFSLNTKTYSNSERGVEAALSGIGLLAMAMMFLSTFSAFSLIKERENGTFYRVIASPWSLKAYMLQNILCYLTILVCQVAVMLLIVRYVFGMYLGPSVLNLLLVMIVFALLCVATGIALAAVARNVRQASTIATMVITPMSMLSGLFWPRSIMPEILQTIGRYLPPTWLVDAAQKVMLGEPLSSAALELSILLGFIVVFFLLGTWRRADVAK